ncbi:MAG: hypothetical protein RMK29_19745 [Myxococcales bacterium]|nr:hypothetical protein [Myxococcales bacterium]
MPDRLVRSALVLLQPGRVRARGLQAPTQCADAPAMVPCAAPEAGVGPSRSQPPPGSPEPGEAPLRLLGRLLPRLGAWFGLHKQEPALRAARTAGCPPDGDASCWNGPCSTSVPMGVGLVEALADRPLLPPPWWTEHRGPLPTGRAQRASAPPDKPGQLPPGR